MVSGASGAARSQKAQQWKRPNTIGTRERAWQKRQKTRRDVQRRTRRSASTIGGAAPDTIIGRAAADRAGARPYRATRCENASPETPIRQYADPPTRFPCRRPILTPRRHHYMRDGTPGLLRMGDQYGTFNAYRGLFWPAPSFTINKPSEYIILNMPALRSSRL